MNIINYLLENGQDERIVLITEETTYTYRDLRLAVAYMASQLLQDGIVAGDHVCLLADNSFFWVVSYLAILQLGAVAVPLPTIITQDELVEAMHFTSSHAICIQSRLLRQLDTSGLTIISDDLLLDQYWYAQAVITPEIGEVAAKNAALATLMWTSGTTSQPKAVQISQHNIQANTDSIVQYLRLTEQDRMMVVLPFSYCFGASLLHTHLRAGASLVLSNRFAFPETVLDLMEETQCTGFAGVPAVFHTLLRNTSLHKRKLPALRKIQQAGGRLSSVLIKELSDSVPQADIYIMYGQTEATARLSYLPPQMLCKKNGSIGRGMQGVTLRVINNNGDPVQLGEVGEIVANGKNITHGYLNNPELTAQKFIEGKLYTGDLATVDEDGYIYIVDRQSDIIKPFGIRVSSQKIEGYMLELPDVVNVAAIGVPDLVRGEAVRVYVVLVAESKLTVRDIIQHFRRRLPRAIVPTQIEIVDNLPLNGNGKLVRSRLHQLPSSNQELQASRLTALT